MTYDTLLVYPDFSKPFYINDDASKSQLRGIIYQDRGIIAYHSFRLTKYQENNSTPEKEALNIVDVLKIHSSNLSGNKMHAHADSLNSSGKNKLFSRLTRWLLLMQECYVHLNHINGKDNLFADALSRLPRLDDMESHDCENKMPCTNFCCTIDNAILRKESEFALDLNIISHNQLADCTVH